MKQVLLLFLVGFLLVFYFPFSAFAVTVGPAKITERTNPGDTISGDIVLINDSNAKQTLYPAFEKFTEVNGEKKFLPGEPTALTAWFRLPKSVTLNVGEQKRIPFTIKVPKDAPPGGHFAVIWWGNAPPEGQVSIVTRAGILVFLQVSGEVNEKGEVLSFRPKGFVFRGMPLEFKLLFKNVGNTWLKPTGDIFIKNIFGTTRAVFRANSGERIILPGNEENLRVAPTFEKKPFLIGMYGAELTLQWGEEAEKFEKSAYFIVLPILPIVIALVVLAAFYFGIKRYNRWIIAKATSNRGRETKDDKR